jgi:hypothetical protein
MRIRLDKAYFSNKIIYANSDQLASNDAFKNYFRGLYFKCENLVNSNSLAMLNFGNGTVTVYYREDKRNNNNGIITYERVSKTFEMNLTGNSISLQTNLSENADYINATSNPNIEASSVYLKGGQGSMAIIDLFGADLDGNGTADELDEIKANGWLINEANLTFHVQKDKMASLYSVEPNRILLYDLTNNSVIADYLNDGTTFSADTKQNKYIFGGFLLDENGLHISQKKDDNTGLIEKKGTKYKIRITDHIKNLIKKDSTNVKLGLVVSESVNNVGFSKLKTPIGTIKSVPTMSVLSTNGTILYGTSSSVPDDKRLKLEIYYTKPN